MLVHKADVGNRKFSAEKEKKKKRKEKKKGEKIIYIYNW